MTGEVVLMRKPIGDCPPSWSDEAVAAACATGDPAAVAELFDRYHGAVLRFISRVVGSGADAEDLLQATFVEVARGKARFEGASQVRTWMFGIAANVARHHLRSNARRSRLARAVATVARSEPPPNPDDALAARRALHQAERALAALPAAQRIAFVLCEIEGLSAEEAATALGSSQTAVWKRVSDARQALKAAARREAP